MVQLGISPELIKPVIETHIKGVQFAGIQDVPYNRQRGIIMKQFNLEEYLRLKEEGKEPKIVTRDGHDAKILCTDMKAMGEEVIGALVMGREGYETLRSYHSDGRYGKYADYELDLFFADLEEEPKYRPYKDADECFRDVLKHGGWVKDNDSQEYLQIAKVLGAGVMVHSHYYKFLAFSVQCSWADDGSPCGVKEGDVNRALELEDGRRIEV